MTALTNEQREYALKIRFSVLRPTIARPTTGDPNAALWRELLRFTGEDGVRDLIVDKRRNVRDYGEGDELVARTKRIQRCIRMANGFYRAFADSDPVVAPIMLYFGSMWLAKALINATLPRSLLDARWDKHGVKILEEPTAPFIDQSVQLLQGGGIPETLCDVLGGSDIRGKEIAVLTLLGSAVDLDPTMSDDSRWEGSRAQHQRGFFVDDDELPSALAEYVRVLLAFDGPISPDVETSLDAKAVLAPLFRALPEFGVSTMNNVGELTWRTWGLGKHAWNMLTLLGAGGARYIECRIEELAIPEPVVLLVLMHALSEYARYHDAEWLAMSDQYTADYAIIREFIVTTAKKFPTIILNELTFRDYRFDPAPAAT